MIQNDLIKNLAQEIIEKQKELELPENRNYKYLVMAYDEKQDMDVFQIINDSGFRAILVGDVRGSGYKNKIGYMYLWHTNDENEKYPTQAALTKMLKAILQKEEYPTFTYYDNSDGFNRDEQKEFYKSIVEKILLGGF